MRSKVALAALTIVLIAGLAGCSTVNDARNSRDVDPLPGSSWNLVSFRAPGRVSVPVFPSSTVSLMFGPDGKTSGSTGCNSFGGTYSRSGSALTVAVREMMTAACDDLALVAQETTVLQDLEQVTSYTILEDQLVLAGSDDAVLLTYTAGISDIAGTSWQVTGVNNGSGVVETTALTSKLNAAFDANGSFSGAGGCNRVAGAYRTTGADGLTIGPLLSTQMACSEPGLMDLDTQYANALEKVARYEIRGSVLIMRDNSGSTQVTATVALATADAMNP
jgi:heat shock protein HslJ